MKKFVIACVHILVSINAFSQYYDSTQLASIQSNASAYEGDLYLDTSRNQFFIGLTNGKLAKLNGADVWGIGDSVGISNSIYLKSAWANGDTVVITREGRMGIGVSSPSVALETSGDIRAGKGYFTPQVLDLQLSGASVNGTATWKTVNSVTIPGGTLDTANAISVEAYCRRTTGSGNSQFRFVYGGAVVASMGNNGNNPVRVKFILYNANGNTGTQEGYLDHSNSGNTGTAFGSASVNSNNDQVLQLQLDPATNTDVWTCSVFKVVIFKP